MDLHLDRTLVAWVLVPVMTVMFLVGVLRHYLAMAMASSPKADLLGTRETQGLARLRLLQANGAQLHRDAFAQRRVYFLKAIDNKELLKNKEEDPNAPMAMMEPGNMDTMMDGMKKNMMVFVPQSIIFTWITYIFSGFVIMKLPFPLTLRFKAMLQQGIMTSEMDVTWVSSISWYFLNLFGQRDINMLILGEDNAADTMRDFQAMGMMPQGQPGAAPVKMSAVFNTEKENLSLIKHEWALKNIEQNILGKHKTTSAIKSSASKKRD